MKNLKIIFSISAFIVLAFITSQVTAQAVQKETDKSKPVPAAVTAIIEKSCKGCHSDDGSSIAKMHVNFTKWSEYSAEEQTSAGQDIAKIVNKDKMPPKKFLKKYPEVKLTEAEKTTLTKWAEAL